MQSPWVDVVVVRAFGAGEFGAGEAYLPSGIDEARICKLEPSGTSSAFVFGQFFASGAGDINRDGIEDIFVSDYNAGHDDVIGTDRAYVFSGITGRVLHEI